MREFAFPFLDGDEPKSIGPADPTFNCVAWAVGDVSRWWWPHEGRYWPDELPREETLDAIIAALATAGYTNCLTSDVEPGIQKVAVYAKAGIPTHVARQHPDGRWSSKLGGDVLIGHATPHGVEGPVYGDVVCYLARPIPARS